MKRSNRIHRQIRKRKINRVAKEVGVYALRYFCPVLVLLIGLYCTFMMVISLGYNHQSGMWDIEYSFTLGIIGLVATIVGTNFTIIGLRKLTDYLDYR